MNDSTRKIDNKFVYDIMQGEGYTSVFIFFGRPLYKEEIMKFIVVLDPAEEGGFNVSVPALDGCFTQGETEEEALENVKEAILCYLEGKVGITIKDLKKLI